MTIKFKAFAHDLSYVVFVITSSRRRDAIAGRTKWTETSRKCEEWNGKMVKVRANWFACTECGLM